MRNILAKELKIKFVETLSGIDGFIYENGNPLEINHTLYSTFTEYEFLTNSIKINDQKFNANYTNNSIKLDFGPSLIRLKMPQDYLRRVFSFFEGLFQHALRRLSKAQWAEDRGVEFAQQTSPYCEARTPDLFHWHFSPASKHPKPPV